jgi:putative endonuclease
MARRGRHRRGYERDGRRGESFAAWWFRVQGWRVIGRRVQTPRGEIDLIVRRGRTVAFIEVKYRRSLIERNRALDAWSIRRAAEGAEAVAHRFAGPRDTVRIDGLLLSPWRWPRHLVNVWQP